MKDLKTAELVALYNETAEKVGRNPVKKFKDRATAEARTKAILAELKDKPINLPYVGAEHKIRANSLRKVFVDLLEDGATEEQLQKAAEAHDKANDKEPKNIENRTRRTLLLLHRYNGFGLRQDGKKLFLVTR